MMPWRPTISIANTLSDYSLSKQVFKKKLIEIHVFHTDNITYIYTTNDLLYGNVRTRETGVKIFFNSTTCNKMIRKGQRYILIF